MRKLLITLAVGVFAASAQQSVFPPPSGGGGGGGGGATIPSTTHLISGDGSGNGADSTIVTANVLNSTTYLCNDSNASHNGSSGANAFACSTATSFSRVNGSVIYLRFAAASSVATPNIVVNSGSSAVIAFADGSSLPAGYLIGAASSGSTAKSYQLTWDSSSGEWLLGNAPNGDVGGASLLSTANCLVIEGGLGFIKCSSDWTNPSHTLTAGASSLFDMSAAASNSIKFPGTLVTGFLTVATTTGQVGSKAIATTDLPGSGATTVDGQPCTLGSTCITNFAGQGDAVASAHLLGTNSGKTPYAATAADVDAVATAAGGGTGQAQTATFAPVISSLTDGLSLCWKPAAANTAAGPTFSPNSLTAETIVKAGGASLVANDITTTAWACAVYDLASTQWELQNPQTTASASGSLPTSPNSSITIGGSSLGAWTLDVNTAYLNILYPQLSSSNTYTSGSKQQVVPSSTTAGLNIAAGNLPSAGSAGDIAISSGGLFAHFDGAVYQGHVTFAGNSTSLNTTTAGHMPVWVSNAMAMGDATCLDSSGSGTAQVCNTIPSFTPVAGTTIVYKTTTTNTGDVTINVNSLGAKHARKWQASATLASGDLVSGVYVLLTYDGTYWESYTIGNAPSGGGGTPCTTTALSLQYNNSGAFGCLAEFTYASSTITGNSSAKIDMSAASATAGLKLPSAAGAIPTADGFIAVNTTTHALVHGSNTTTLVSAVAATGTGTATTCTNQVVTAISGIAAPTCTSLTTAYLPALTSANIFVGNGSNVPTGVAVSGDLSLANTGAFTVTQIEGGTIPTSAVVLGTNSSKQPVASTTTGTGSTVMLNNSPSIGTSYISQTFTVGAAGVTQGLAACADGSAPTKVVTCATGNLVNFWGIAMTTQTSGASVEVAIAGQVAAVADGTVTAGDIVGNGATTAGRIRDLGQTSCQSINLSTLIVGKAQSSATVGNTFQLQLSPICSLGGTINGSTGLLGVGNGGTGTSSPGFASQTDGATVTWAIGSALIANAKLLFTVHSGSRTLNITNPISGGRYQIEIQQDATGGEGLTLGTGCTWKIGGGGSGAVTPSTGANAIDKLEFTYDGANCLGDFIKNYN